MATDAASEGLNLQACSYLINYDMPWNPMRVEQRIGRIDRLGQARDVVHVRNYFIPDTVEESVYRALAGRIDDFRDLLGNLQPILGATERAFQSIFKAPRSERGAAQYKAIDELLTEVDTLEREGISFAPEDPLPLPEHPSPPVTLEDLREVLVDRFAAVIDEPDRPITWDPTRASRDPEGWTALVTYGHPRLDTELARRAGLHLPDTAALVLSGGEGGPAAAVRADRTPPEMIGSVADVDALGPAAARGDAEAKANQLVWETAAARRTYESQILSARRRQWIDRLRRQFISLVHDTLAAGCAASRWEGQDGADPITVWYNLGQDSTNDWAWAAALREHLNIPLARLIPGHLATVREPIFSRRLERHPRPVGRATPDADCGISVSGCDTPMKSVSASPGGRDSEEVRWEAATAVEVLPRMYRAEACRPVGRLFANERSRVCRPRRPDR